MMRLLAIALLAAAGGGAVVHAGVNAAVAAYALLLRGDPDTAAECWRDTLFGAGGSGLLFAAAALL